MFTGSFIAQGGSYVPQLSSRGGGFDRDVPPGHPWVERRDHCKFVSAQPKQPVVPDDGRDARRQRSDQRIARRMAERVVDQFEIIEIDQDQTPILSALRQNRVEARIEEGAVGKNVVV